MSRSINFILNGIAKVLNSKSDIVSITSLSIAATIHAIYSLGTQKSEEISIIKKYTMVRGGFTEFMLVDSTGRHFNVNTSLWYWKWDSLEDYSNLKKGKKVKVKYYGWRVPMFGIFPNIISYF